MPRRHRAADDTRRHTIIVDWDGTAVPAMWPDHPDRFMPGFIEAMHNFHEAGFAILIQSARLNPYDPFTRKERSPGIVASETAWMRNMLDEAGLSFVGIWTKMGKASGSVYIDDKAERYNPSNNAWAAMTRRVLIRLCKEEAVFPAFELEEV